MFIMFAPDLGELAYGSGEVVVLSKEVAPVAPEGEGTDLPISCDGAACRNLFSLEKKKQKWQCKGRFVVCNQIFIKHRHLQIV